MTIHPEDVAARYDRIKQLHVGILVFPEVEVLDFAGPFEVFSVAARIHANGPGAIAPFKVSLIGASGGQVMARHNMAMIPHLGFADAPALDILIVPGGVVTQPLSDPSTLAWIGRQAEGAAITASVCTGAFLLAKAGLLEGCRVTTHWNDIAGLRENYPQLDVVENVQYVDQGRIVTSAGISAGIGMSLHLVERVLGAAAALATAHRMEYDWPPRAD
jgi:transcriptional regulator GlxA family with amidase domain